MTSKTTSNGMAIWSKVLLLVTIGKAAIAGAGVGLAALGIADLATLVGAKQMIALIHGDHIFDIFAAVGGLVGATAQIVWSVISR